MALLVNGDVRQKIRHVSRRHGDFVIGMMNDLLRESGLGLRQLDALAFGRGPGSFTGVRIATAVVQGAAFGADLPVAPVSTLAALAQGQFRASGSRRSLAALDARMEEIYWGVYRVDESGHAVLDGVENVIAPADVDCPGEPGWCGVGSGWAAYPLELGNRLDGCLESVESDRVVEARDIAELASSVGESDGLVAPEQAFPVYLRDKVAARPSAIS